MCGSSVGPRPGTCQAQETDGWEPTRRQPGLAGAAGLNLATYSASDMLNDLEQVLSPSWACVPVR